MGWAMRRPSSRRGPAVNSTPKRRHRNPQYETLEPRQVMAAGITASLDAAGVLIVVGSDGDDQFLFRKIGKYDLDRGRGWHMVGK